MIKAQYHTFPKNYFAFLMLDMVLRFSDDISMQTFNLAEK